MPDMIDKSLPSVISAKLLFRRAAAPSSTSTSSYSSSSHRSTATCLSVHSCIRGVADLPRSILFPRKSLDRCEVDFFFFFFLPNEKSQADVTVKMFPPARKKGLRVFKFEYDNREFSTRGNGEIFAQRIYVISGLNSLAILPSGVDRAKGKLG